MTHWHHELLCTAWNKDQLPPPTLEEVAFAGRSNVGKSTLINALLNRTSKKIAKVSSTPGKTRSLNFYRVETPAKECFCLVDLPGYGFAARGPSERRSWGKLIEDYFTASGRSISFVIQLIDFRHGPLENDEELISWLDAIDMPRLIVFTKGDKVPKGRRRGLYSQYLAAGLESIAPPFITSGKNDDEVERMRTAIPEIMKELSRIGP